MRDGKPIALLIFCMIFGIIFIIISSIIEIPRLINSKKYIETTGVFVDAIDNDDTYYLKYEYLVNGNYYYSLSRISSVQTAILPI